MPPTRWIALFLLATLAALPGCGRTPDEPAPQASALSGADADATAIDATWQGVLPCADCDGIETRLRLVADDEGRRFELQEAYLAADGGDRFEAQGEWTQASVEIGGTPTAVYGLDVDGATRWFSLGHDGSLEQLESRDQPSPDGARQRLQRQ